MNVRWPHTRLATGTVHCIAAAMTVLGAFSTPIFAANDTLSAEFLDPPSSARPRVWWHWLNGNISKDGIGKDLEWMKRIGIGGAQTFDAGLSAPQVVDKPVTFMTPEWKDAFRYATSRADQLGLELAIAASPGWSETGGPWVQPKDGMKKLVWSETPLIGGKRFNGALNAPPNTTGPFQTLSGGMRSASYYADAVVLAYPQQLDTSPTPRFSTAAGDALDAGPLSDESLETALRVDTGTPQQPGVLLITYETPQTVRSMTLYLRDAAPMFGAPDFLPRLEVRDGAEWRVVSDVPLSAVPTTVSFATVTAKEFRLVIARNKDAKSGMQPPDAPGAIASTPRGAPKQVRIATLKLSNVARVNRFEAKAGFAIEGDYYALAGTGNDADNVIAPDKVIDLSARVKDGVLDWTPPRGRWTVLRLGYSLTGVMNHPASDAGRGLEVDKYDAGAVKNYLTSYLNLYRDITGSDLMGQRGLRALVTDSTEVGASNWTPDMLELFQRLRGYDARPWLPALTGVLIGSRAQSDAFLYDFRRALGDLTANAHYGQLATTAHDYGLKVYGEALEGGRPVLGDDIAMRSYADVPMAALWAFRRSAAPNPSAFLDMKGAASVAHVYGQNLVAAESMTSANAPWAYAPAELKRVIDYEFASGVNLPVIHTSVHQPVDKAPGLSLSIFGQYFTRLETWAEMAKPWVDYIARNAYLLQQGRNVADVAYFYGEEAPLTLQFNAPKDAPVRYAYDFVNSDALLKRLTVDNGQLVATGGARYRVLYLGGSSDRMTLAVLRRIAELVEAGATVVGRAPHDSPALTDDRAEFERIVKRLWSGASNANVGKGRVIADGDVEAALAAIGIAPDFSFEKSQADSQVLFVHRRIDDGDLYYLNNRNSRDERLDARFHVTGKQPEIWHADTGASEPVSYRIEGDTTIVPLDMLADDSFFMVFRKPVGATAMTVSKPALVPVAELNGSWEVAFQAQRGAPPSARLDSLASLSEHAEPGIKYFSGVATYAKHFKLPKNTKPGTPLLIDLGQVGDVAEVRVNGTSVGTLWKAPYRVDIGPAVQRGDNRLEVRVANLWANRLIGDAQPGAQKIAVTGAAAYKADAPLRPSGLIGPVRLFGINNK